MLGPEEIGRSSPALGFLRQSPWVDAGALSPGHVLWWWEGDFEHPSVSSSCRCQSSVVGRSCSMEDLRLRALVGDIWDIGRRLLSALMVFCVTTSRIVLYSTIHTVPCLPTMIERSSPSAIPGTKSLSLSISCHKRQSRTRRVARQNRGCIRTGRMQAHNRVFFVPITVIEL
jgi:hypothetical protein